MKEVVIMSGKGGTGKTSISAALALLAPAKVLADCDVDAANLNLLTGHKIRQTNQFFAGFEPVIDQDLCTRCGRCTDLCRYLAIKEGTITSKLGCEGCGVCADNCPATAITMIDKAAGSWFISDTRFGPLVHAELGLAVENSGKLVSQVRQQAKLLAEHEHVPLIITDGPPGVGCPAIAALSGADLVLGVVEPSLSGMHDLKRLISLAGHFNVPVAVCINKATINSLNTHTIIAWCHNAGIAVVGEIPYNEVFRHAAQKGVTVMEVGNAEIEQEISKMWYKVAKILAIPADDSPVDMLSRKLKSFVKKRAGD